MKEARQKHLPSSPFRGLRSWFNRNRPEILSDALAAILGVWMMILVYTIYLCATAVPR